MRRTVQLLLIIWATGLAPQFSNAQSYTAYFTGNAANSTAVPAGGICLMGGATEHDGAMRWFLEQANGGDVLVLRASGSDGYNTYLYSDLGVTVNSVETIVCHDASCANEAYVQEKVANAEAIWFAGGNQWTYIDYWRGTAIDSIINDGLLYRNLVIGGTSAGMAIQGSAYFSAQNGTVTSAAALADPFNATMSVDTTAFLRNRFLEDVITDTHYDNPDRKGRHAAFLARLVEMGRTPKGIACDEYTAVCIDTTGIARVFGEHPDYDDNAYFVRPNCALTDSSPEQCAAGQPLIWHHNGQALVVYQVKGTATGSHYLNLNDWETGSGGSWMYWSVQNNSVSEVIGNQPDCAIAGISEWSEQVVVYPNPATSYVELSLQPHAILEGMYTSAGTKVAVERTGNRLNITTLAAGVYDLRVLDNAVIRHYRMVKQ